MAANDCVIPVAIMGAPTVQIERLMASEPFVAVQGSQDTYNNSRFLNGSLLDTGLCHIHWFLPHGISMFIQSKLARAAVTWEGNWQGIWLCSHSFLTFISVKSHHDLNLQCIAGRYKLSCNSC